MPISDEVLQQIPHLKVGSPYLVDHIRKGPFVGEFKGTRPIADPDDPSDTFFLEVDAYTEEGSGQERLANAFVRDEFGNKRRPVLSAKLIRPSLLRSITRPSAEGQQRLLEQFTNAHAAAQPAAVKPSVPTKMALERLNDEKLAENVGRKVWWKYLLGR